MSKGLGSRLAAEGVATFALVFVGTGAIAADHLTQGAVTHVGVSASFGLVVMAMIYAVGDVSGAHLNPAVTLGMWWARRLDASEVLPYIASQSVAAIVASACVRGFFGAETPLGVTAPSGAWIGSFVLEISLSFLLVYTILNVTASEQASRWLAGAAIGAVVGVAALVGGPVSGASMNPARSLGPALVSGQLADLWIYFAAPSLGAGLAVFGCRCTRGGSCCAAVEGL